MSVIKVDYGSIEGQVSENAGYILEDVTLVNGVPYVINLEVDTPTFIRITNYMGADADNGNCYYDGTWHDQSRYTLPKSLSGNVLTLTSNQYTSYKYSVCYK